MGLRVRIGEAECVLEITGVLEIIEVLVTVDVVEGQGDGAGVGVTVLVLTGVPVGFDCFVELVDVVDVLETLVDLVPERVLTMVMVFFVEPVVVRVCDMLLVVDVVDVDERD